MKPSRPVLLCALVGAVAAAGWQFLAAGAPVSREGPAASRPAEGVLHVPQCRIRLMDEVQLASERTGILDSLAPEGSVVGAGSVVARIRDQTLRASLAMAEREATNNIEVRFAAAASELAQLKYIRAVEANRSAPGTVSELDLRELRLGAEKSLLQLEQAEHQFAIAGLKRDEIRILLEAYRVEAPFDAFVLEVFRKPGEVVREGEPILTLVNTGRVRVEGFVALDALEFVRLGQPVEVVAGLPEPGSPAASMTFPGRLAFVDVKVEPVSGKVRVWAEVLNRENLLRDGLTATMVIHDDRSSRPR
ncbi:MAG TPA: HlyD family efflux transporter periplasmic adaptor subunit [Planctomycetaceae bacterium]|nr:HlyD family efflux transporter periplasmic adaptor subunit [Planctomycetaceae bacterium]